MSFQLWRRIDSVNQTVKVLWVVIGILVFLNLMLFWGWQSAPQRLRIFVAPTQIAEGATVQADVVPDDVVYAFTFQVFSAMNTWSMDGNTDYISAIKQYRYYETDGFYHDLMDDYETRKAEGSLDRLRAMTGYSGMGFMPGSVTARGEGVWEVDLKLQVVERVGNTIVKDVLIQYPMRVVRTNLSVALNPWGLAIDGYVQTPQRIKTFV